MRHWHRQFLGRTQMPSTLSALAISAFFTLSGAEVQAVLSRYGADMRLGTALQIGFLKMCGRPLDPLQRVPTAVLEHLSPQVGGSTPDLATLRAFYSSAPRVLHRHQQIALDVLGLIRFDATADSPGVPEALCDTVRADVDADQLLSETRVILYERRYVIPASRTLGDLAQLARSTVEREISAIERTISPAARARWVEQLFESRTDGMTQLEFLQEPLGSLNIGSITRQCDKVRQLMEMNVAALATLPGTERYWQLYAGRMRNQRRSRFAQRKEPRRSIELISFLRHSLAAHTDALIRMADRQISRLWGRASQQATADRGALPALNVLLAELRQTIKEKRQSKARRFDAIAGLVRRYDAGDLKPLSVAAQQRAILVGQIRQIRPLLKSLVGLDLHAEDPSHWPALIGAWKEAYQQETVGLTVSTPVSTSTDFIGVNPVIAGQLLQATSSVSSTLVTVATAAFAFHGNKASRSAAVVAFGNSSNR